MNLLCYLLVCEWGSELLDFQMHPSRCLEVPDIELGCDVKNQLRRQFWYCQLCCRCFADELPYPQLFTTTFSIG